MFLLIILPRYFYVMKLLLRNTFLVLLPSMIGVISPIVTGHQIAFFIHAPYGEMDHSPSIISPKERIADFQLH